MSRSSPKFAGEPINEFFWTLALDGDEDAFTGGDEMTRFSLFVFPDGVWPDDVDGYNINQFDFEDQLNASEIVKLCTEMVGAILVSRTDGSVTADLYTDRASLDRDWQQHLDDTTLEQCDECQAEAEEYGKNSPIQHLDGCSVA